MIKKKKPKIIKVSAGELWALSLTEDDPDMNKETFRKLADELNETLKKYSNTRKKD